MSLLSQQGLPRCTSGEESACQRRILKRLVCVGSLRWEDPLGEGMTTHSNILAWRIPWTEEPGALRSIELHRLGHD